MFFRKVGLVPGICIFLVAITWIVFGQTLTHDFVNFDDRTYVYGNPIVSSGLTLRGILWAFVQPHALNWHPLTTISHMLDCQLFELNAGGHHFTNVLLHTIAVVLLFFVIRSIAMSGINDLINEDRRSRLQRSVLWRSALVATLFAIHPLHVESVAWIAERKDVLSAVFFMLTLGAYVRYTRKPTVWRYLLTSILFACGLMSKPMLVTVPFVLLLLDYWPLGRVRGQRSELSSQESAVGGLVVEKIPLFAMSAASCVATIIAQRGAAGGMEQLPFTWRIQNAAISYVIYVWQMFWPAKLAVFYPAISPPIWQVASAFALVIAMSAIALVSRRKYPYIFTGWFWYLGMLVPVIGIFQIGLQGHADRYTYLPQIGLYLMMIWLLADLLRPLKVQIVGGLAAIMVLLLAWQSWGQTKFWKDSETLWTHALNVTNDNDIAHNNLGQFYVERGRIDDAIAQYQAALQIRSGPQEARYNLSNALVHTNLGNALVRKGRVDDAVGHYQKAIALRPDYADGHFNLGAALLEKGQVDGAIREFRAALSIRPEDAEAHEILADLLVREHQINEAMSQYLELVRLCELRPSAALVADLPHICVSTLNKLAWVFSTSPESSLRNGARGIELAQQINGYSHQDNPLLLRTLAAAYAESGRFDDAIKAAQRAIGLAKASGQEALGRKLEEDMDLYRQQTPLRDFNLTNAQPGQ